MCVRYDNIHKLIDIPDNIHIYLELNSLSETICNSYVCTIFALCNFKLNIYNII